MQIRAHPKVALPAFNFAAQSSSDPSSPTLHDSKSASNLYQNSPQQKKFRETTYLGVAKNTSRDFLRYTIGLNNSEKEPFILHTSPSSRQPIPRKLTSQEGQKKPKEIMEQSLSDKQASPQKKPSNPEKKQQTSPKLFAVPKFLTKKQSSDTHKLEGSKAEIPFAIVRPEEKSPEKKTFVPKLNKTNQNLNKINLCPSTSDLKEMKHDKESSLTRESLSGYERERVISSPPVLQDFKKLKFLGEGKFGQVHLVRHIKTNSLFALKQIKKEMIIKNKMQDQLLLEIRMQLYLDHPNILKLYGVFNDMENIYLILEYMEEGTLYSALRKKKVFKQIDASKKLRDILDAMTYLHSHNIAHRDIKPENVVISNDVCKICDLGWATICDDRRKTLCGTIDYASPELLEGKEYGIAIDLWCLGVLCYELVLGKCPFYHISRKQTMRKIINADLSDLNLPNSLPLESRDFICKLLVKNPEQRMTANAALNHPLITKYYDEDIEGLRSGQKRK